MQLFRLLEFFKIYFSCRNIIRVSNSLDHQCIKQFGSRSGPTFRRAWSGSKLFAKMKIVPRFFGLIFGPGVSSGAVKTAFWQAFIRAKNFPWNLKMAADWVVTTSALWYRLSPLYHKYFKLPSQLHLLSNSYTMGCPPYVQVDKYSITILYHLHQCRPCTSRDISC